MTDFTSSTTLKQQDSPLPLPLSRTAAMSSSSSSTLCQGSLEPNVLVRNQTPPRKTNETLHIDTNKNRDSAFWNSISTQNYGYSSPILSPKSLELCTESLGSETGSSIGESIEDFPEGFQVQPWRLRESQKKIFRSSSFPPPLTSVSGSDGVQVSSHREDGRLVLRAVSVGCSNSLFQTERSNGRLKLSLYQSPDSEEFDLEDDDGDADEEVNGDYDEEDEDEADGEHVGFENFLRLSTRCKEGGGNRNKGWEPSWVAIS